ncbi:hypothetical protein FB45DRAFT_903501 [Roridomyces roridus]|uniref:Uncharacterized protein n=1 Tax=Roridomyces roridus TaxID=1738132 RepID=A0AAD7C4G9_9AGAR|nr:hypothetical protein FB45DRAFT_903501 [Roridomyces roridus]
MSRRRFLLALLGVASIVLCATFTLRPIPSNADPQRSSADVTAVLLNWARLSNVVSIVTELCSPQLATVMKKVVIWNNSPRPIGYNDFVDAHCPPTVLQIHNSQQNEYFQARFLACANASTPYCFIQDDDYLVKSEAIRSLRARVEDHDIYLLPPDEVLSSRLLSINSPSTKITFSFSWLGYGALIHRNHAVSFLSLLMRLGTSQEETRMADNYYSILRNSFPEIWTSAPIALSSEGAFTVGDAGVARNNKHIVAATKYLDSIVANASQAWPYVSRESRDFNHKLQRSPCLGRSCVLESNMRSLPDILDTFRTAGEIFDHQERLGMTLSEDITSTFLNYPLSHAVDADPQTSFRSVHNIADGDSLVLDLLDAGPDAVDWVWLVDADTAQVLRTSSYSHSTDRSSWIESRGSVSCRPSGSLEECRIPMHRARFFRMEYRHANLTFPWRIHETWLDT